MNIIGLLKWVWNRKKYPHPKKINIHTISNFAEAELRRFNSIIGVFKPQQHIIEQSIWRSSLIEKNCSECFLNRDKEGIRRCTKACGCDIDGIIWQTDKHELDCFPKMMEVDVWNQFKIINNIKINKDGI